VSTSIHYGRAVRPSAVTDANLDDAPPSPSSCTLSIVVAPRSDPGCLGGSERGPAHRGDRRPEDQERVCRFVELGPLASLREVEVDQATALCIRVADRFAERGAGGAPEKLDFRRFRRQFDASGRKPGKGWV
jgi:hypothetical protein